MPSVTVIVPVFEPGPRMEPLIASLLAQTLPAPELEVILVDDGSGDDTFARLQALAARHAHVSAERIEHTGWPSAPRNAGLRRARGEYVFFADQDDRLDPEALERLVARAREDGADVVVGKVVGHGKVVPRPLFAENRTGVTLAWAPLIRLLTPHKLFRRGLLTEHDIWFPEDGRRLEDHVFVLNAYFRAGTVSILADHPVYHWIRHGEGENASSRRMDPASYYGRVAELLDLIDAHVEPGAVRDQLYAYYLRGKLYAQLSGRAFLERDEGFGRALYEAVRDLTVARFPVEVERRLTLRHRLRGGLVRADDVEGLRALAALEARMRATAVLVGRRRRGQALALRLETALTVDGAPLEVRMRGIELLWAPPGVPGAGEIDLAGALQYAYTEIALVSAEDRTQYTVALRGDVRLDPLGGDRFTPVLLSEGRIHPGRAAAGAPLPAGRWRLRVAPSIGGFVAETERFARVGDEGLRRVVLDIEPDGRLAVPPAPPPSLLRRVRGAVARRLPAALRRPAADRA